MTNAVYLRALSAAAAALYLCAAVLYVIYRKKKPPRTAVVLWSAGAAASVSLVAVNWIKNGYAPFVSIYQILCFLAVCSSAVYLFVSFAGGVSGSEPVFLALAAVISVGLTVMDSGGVWHFPPALDSVFFVPHVVCYMLAYITAGAAAAFVVFNAMLGSGPDAVYQCVRVSFPFMTAGLFLGAIWANEVWGAYWSWDVKECWSLFTWLCFALYLHLRGILPRKYEKYAGIAVLCGFAGVIITMFFVNLMNGASPHAYSA